MGKSRRMCWKVRVEGVQPLYLPGQAEVRAGGWGELQPDEAGKCQGSCLPAGEGNGDYGGAGAFSYDLALN